ncbi:MAG: TVP38/TMEM64 family protein [Candidatus Coproplasma sp.]
MAGWSLTVRIICYCIAAVGVIFETVTFLIDREALFKSGFILVAFVAIVVVFVAIITQVFSLGDYPSDEQKTQRLIEIIKGAGAWGYLVYFIIQVLQVVILPLPAVVCYVPGSIIWGPLTATLIASAGVITGSVISYLIGKYCGKPVVIWIAGKETTEKYTNILSKKGKILFLIMQILPFFPDDIICIVAGLTGMNFIYFSVVIAAVRPAIIAMYCYLGSGTIIPFSGWGIPVWIAIFVVCIVLAVLSFIYQDRIETWLVKKFKRKKKDDKEIDGDQPQNNEDGDN